MHTVHKSEPEKERGMATAETHMQLRLRSEDKERIKRSADLRGVNASQFMLCAALKEAEHVEADQNEFALDEGRYNAFMDALGEPPARNRALNKLLHAKAPWD